MKHAVVGLGGVGGLIAAALARGGHDVLGVVRPGTADSYPPRLRIESVVLGDFEQPVPVTERLTGWADVVWLAVKATQLSEALAALPPQPAGPARLVSLLNGIDHHQMLAGRYPNAIAGAIRVESARAGAGWIRQTSPFIRVELSAGPDIVAALAEAGIDARVGPDARSLLWQKLAFLAPLALATTAFDAPLGEVRELAVFAGCQAEVLAIAKHEGAALDESAVRSLTSLAPPGMYSSMQRDLAAGQPLELDAIAGPVVRGGRSHGVPTPATDALVTKIASRGGLAG